MINENFVLLGVAIQFLGGLGYLKDTLKGDIQPNKVSWLLWTIAPMIAFYAEVKQGVGIQSLTTFIVGFVPLLVFLASFVNRKAKWEVGRLDMVCGAFSLMGIIFWYITRAGNIAIFFSLLADGLAFIPTLIKAYSFPETESSNVFITGIISSGITLLTITHWDFETVAFPLYLFIADGIASLFIQFQLGKKLKKSRAS